MKRPPFAFVATAFVLLTKTAVAGDGGAWLITPEKLQSVRGPMVAMRGTDGSVKYLIQLEHLQMLQDVYSRIAQATSVQVDELVLTGDSAPNAFATKAKNGERIVVVTTGMLKMVDGNKDQLAAVMAHEFGHQALNHQGYANTTQAIDAAGALIALLAGRAIKNPTGAAIATLAGTAAATAGLRSFDRDQERAADNFGVEYMIRAGFDASGAARI